jgi:predicted anti-sigma-YlaC factor YlaD
MTCQEITELVTDYLERRLSLRDRLRLRWHLGLCRHCRAYMQQIRMAIRIAGRLPDEPLPQALQAELPRRFHDFER